ncbi:MAG TPA: amino acid adenylation domain-containing protein, partial [Myxococcus sp.]|nr:amino acid adenylation domain-containing protein [Myxococcus sp.]
MADQDATAGGSGNDIAIIGMAGRFPGAGDMRAFWRNLCEGVESISRLAPEVLEASPVVPQAVRAHPDFVSVASVLEGGESFDAGFFDVAPREARVMDPQQRVFLECAWAALEDAAYDPERYTGKISLYAGAGLSLHALALLSQGQLDPASLYEVMGTTGENLSTRASFKLKLRGESMAVYTACSTGLVAVHMACQSLLLRQSDMALAGAVRLSLPQRTGYLFQDGMILSPDGHCRAFDAKAAGTVPGNGVTAVVLKPLEDALRDGDHVYAVIRGSALNNDGGMKVGYTAPSVEGQADVIGEALAYAGLEAGDIGYVEAHGTGTALGDPIEVAALTRAYRKHTDKKGYCGLGSLKTNIGHLDTAAGLAGLMKAALALHHEELPPSLNFEKPNPAIDFANSPFFVVNQRRPWPRGDTPRRAGVSSFGIGGTNAHAVLEEAPLPTPSAPSARPTQLFTLSARTASALATASKELADWLEAAPADVALADVAFTRAVGRRGFEHRRTVVAKDRAELLAKLRKPGRAQVLEDLAAAKERRVAFLLPGQGAQSPGMGRELYAAEPAFREALDACLTELGPQLETALRGALLSEDAKAGETLADPRSGLPALFCVEYALARLWESWGVKPHAVLGHSFGEYVAACLAGVMPLEDALALVAARGRLMARMPPGSMTAVGCAEEVVRPLLSGGLALASVNGPERCVVSGPTPEVEALERELAAKGVGVLRLPAGHAFHSAAVEPLMEELSRVVAGLRLSAPRMPYVSSVTGTWIRAEEATDPAYWARQMRAPVRFGDGLEALKEDGCTVFLEVGPDQALTSLARLGLRGHPGKAVASLPPRSGSKAGEHAALMEALGALWELGLPVDWPAVYAHEERRRVPLPGYPFERQPFGLSLPVALPAPVAAAAPVPEAPAPVATEVAPPSDRPMPRSEVERKVMEIWRERLGRADFGIHDDFLELGGNSLMAAQMLTRLREAFPVQLPLSDLFEAPTVAGVAARIQARMGITGPEAETALPPLVRVPRDGALPLSVVQERVCSLEQALPGNPALNMALLLRLSGTLDVAVLERSLETVTRRHEALRTSYPRVDGRTMARVAPELRLPLPVEPVPGDSAEAREAAWPRLVHEETARPFDVERGPVVRARLLRLAPDEHLLAVTVHHVVCDTWSLVVLGRELGACYGAFAQGQPSPLPELAVQYADYAAWQRKVLEAGAFSEQVAAWRERLVGLPGPLDLPVDKPRHEGPALSAIRRNVGFSRTLTAAVYALAQREGITPFMVMLASWKALLGRWAGRDDLVVGTPIGNRSRPELEPVIGYVAHAVPLRTDLSGNPTFRELMGRVRDVVLEAYANPDVPYEHLVREVEPTKDPGRERVFDTLFILHNRFAPSLELPGLRMRLVEVQDGPAQFGGVLSSLSVSMGEDEEGFTGTLDYAEERFEPATMERLVAHWTALLGAAVAEPDLRLSELPLETAASRARPVRAVEAAPVAAAALLEARAAKDDEAVALTAADGRGVTWGELRARARRLAAELVARGVGPEVLVAVCLEPSVERVVALWAVLEAGGAYVQLSVPQLRELASLAPESGRPPLLLAHPGLKTGVPLDPERVLFVEPSLPEGAPVPRPRRPANLSAEAMVCLEPLTGAAGERLRAIHTHRTVAERFRRLDAEGAKDGDAWLAAEEPQAPGSGLELLWALTRGLRVVLPPEKARYAITATGRAASRRGPDFSLSFFANDEDSLGGRKYRLLLDAAKFADAQGFSAVWTPERHFHAFGGLYPRPAVVGAGVATVTERLGIRAGSVVLPLHDPVLVAEEWSVLDNLSNGRVGVSFASGWHANDFVFAPDRYAKRKEVMFRGIEEVRTLWRGGTVRRRNGAGDEVEVSLRPRPVQKDLPFWLTAAGSPDTFRMAGELGAYVLTNLMGQDLDDLAGKVALYREAWRQHGHPGRGHVSLMLHTYLGADLAEARQRVRQPLLSYFRSSVDILAGFVASLGMNVDPRSLTPADVDALLDHGVERYVEDGGLFGTPDTCAPVVERVRKLDVDEVACLVDFGVEVEATLEGLRHLDTLRSRYAPEAAPAVPTMQLHEGPGIAESLLSLVREADITWLHCTGALARALAELPSAAEALRPVHRVLVDGAAAEAASLARLLPAAVVLRDPALGVWGPAGGPAVEGTFVPWEVVDAHGRPVPPGVVGELALEGAGVPRGFWNAAGSASLRLLTSVEDGSRRLATGRRARRRADGSLELLAAVPVPARRPKPPKSTAGTQAKKAEGPPPIPRVPRSGPLPLSFAQQRLWYLDRLEPGNAAYNNAVTLILTGELDAAVLRRALNEVVRRHEILRTTFAMSESGAVQLIVPALEVALPLTVSEGAGEAQVDRWAREEARRPFDLEAGPLLRAGLLRVGDTEHVLLLVLHHIASDGWSGGVMMHELARLYAAFLEGQPSPLPALPVQYADYAVWQREWMRGPELKTEQDWWRGVLADVPVLRLPTDRPRPPVQTYAGTRLPVTVSRRLTDALAAVGRREGATPFMVLMAAWQWLLRVYSGQDDFAVGTPVAGRNRPEVEPLIGCFVNSIALRADLTGDPTFLELLGRVRRTALGAFAHQEVPFEKLVDALQVARDLSHTPLFQTMLVLHNTPAPELSLGGMSIRSRLVNTGTAKLDIALELVESQEGLAGAIEYNTDLFDADTASRLAGHLLRLLERVAEAPEKKLSGIDLLSQDERKQVVVEWNATATEYPRGTTLPEVFAQVVARHADKVAVEFGEQKLTYRQLDARANQLAWHLRGLGVGPDERVAVALERSLELVVALVGILKAGAAYVPLDAEYPRERLAAMVEDARPKVLVTTGALLAKLPGDGLATVVLEQAPLSEQPTQAPPCGAQPGSLAYIDFTSGSTGRPKGVGTPQSGVLRTVFGVDYAHLGPDETFLLIAPVSFDASTLELWGPLLHGGRLVVFPPRPPSDVYELEAVLVKHGVTTLHLTSGLFTQMVDVHLAGLRTVRQLLTGGDVVSAPHVRRVLEQLRIPVTACYGPTETTLFAACHRMTDVAQVGAAVPLGRPIGNTQVYVLDGQGQPVPVGVAGELYVGGDGVARGYVEQPALTAERFVPDRFSGVAGARLYRTGDLARWRKDGVLEFLGRADAQVKVRGYRVELAEIEAALQQHPDVREAVVVARVEGAGDKRLVAYVTAKEGGGLESQALRAHVGGRLPEYMVPSAVVVLEALPLTTTGKLDRKALPAPAAVLAAAPREHAAPRDSTEEALASIWAAVLRVPQVGIHDNFFALGGDSILSLQLIARARAAGLHLTPRHLFQHPTIAQLAAVVATAPASQAEQGLVEGEVPLTPIQRAFLETHSAQEPHHFNQAVMLEVKQRLNASVLEAALRKVVEHHDALRLRFAREDGRWQQYNLGAVQEPLSRFVDLSGVPEDGRARVIAEVAGELHAGFRLEAPPLLRAALFDGGRAGDVRLLLVAHHLVVDTVSWRVLVEDLELCCEMLSRGQAPSLPPKTTPFKDWAERLRAHALSEALTPELSYWLDEARQQVASLPRDLEAGPNTAASARHVSASLDLEDTRLLLREVPTAWRAQVQEVLLTALGHALASWSGQSRFLVDSEGHGREDLFPGVDLSRTVGWFTAVYPLLLELPAGASPGEGLRAVRDGARRLPGKGLGYGLLRHLRQDARLRALPSAEVSFNYLGQLDSALGASSLFRLSPELPGPAISPRALREHLVDVNAYVQGERLHVSLAYSEHLHTASTAQALADGFLQALRTLIATRASEDARRYTPSDFPLARLSQPVLDTLVPPGTPMEDVYPLSPLQQGMLFQTLMAPGTGVYVTQLGWTFDASLDLAACRQAWQLTVERHAALRTSFVWEGLDAPLQRVHPMALLPIEEQDWSGLTPDAQAERFEALLAGERARGFSLHQPPLMRLTLVRLGTEGWRVLWTHHHLLMDGWSLGLLLQELLAAYGELRAGRMPPRDSAPRYGDYIHWLQGQSAQQAEAYWRQALRGFTSPTPLPGALPGSAQGTARRKDTRSVRLSAEESQALQAFVRRHQLTPNVVTQAAWALVLSLHTGQRDVLVGATVSGRSAPLPDIERTVGLFINTLPVRIPVTAEAQALAWLKELNAQQQELRQYEHTPLVRIQGWSEVPRGTALFDSLFIFENYPLDSAVGSMSAGLGIRDVAVREQADTALEAVVVPREQLTLNLTYDTARFEAAQLDVLLGHWATALRELVARPEQRLGDVSLLGAEERRRVVVEWNATATEYPRGRTLPEVFAGVVARHADKVAVEFGEQKLTYRQLDEKANQLAWHLRGLGVGTDSRVAIALERSLELVVALVGILKAGAAYVPLDAEYPRERLAAMVEDARPKVLVTTRELLAKLPVGTLAPVVLEEAGLEKQPVEAPPPAALPESLAYIDFTSGSTGRPKGVGTPQSAVLRTVFGVDYAHLGPDETFLLIAPVSFDASTLELWGPLLHGGRLVVFPPHAPSDVQELEAVLVKHGVTTLHLTAGLFSQVVDTHLEGLRTVRQLLTGGDVVSAPHVRRVLEALRIPVTACYGPTETTLFASCHRMTDVAQVGTSVPIGRPIGNTQVYVLDAAGQPVPAGVTGELFIGGEGVARGYVEQPALTAERFVPDGFSGVAGARLYRTGDLARWRADGVLEFLGRADAQVKVRGYRIELAEVEAALLAQPRVREAVATVREEVRGDKRLVAYVVSAPGSGPLDTAALRAGLKERLPEYMQPSAVVVLDALPLTPQGKVDRKALPAPDFAATRNEHVAPRDSTEEVLASIWADVLRVPQVGIHDNFFELGGDSILSLQLIARARAAGLHLTPRQLFQHPTIAQLSAVVATAPSSQAEQGLVEGEVPLTPIQQAFLEAHASEELHHFNQAVMLGVKQRLHASVLEAALSRVVEHHDALRLRFTREDGRWRQHHAGAPRAPKPRYVDLTGVPEAERAHVMASVADELHASFQLGEPPLLRAALFDGGREGGTHLLLVAHHLVVDTLSWRVLVEDLELACQALTREQAVVLPPKTTSFKSWAEHLQAHARSEALTAERPYWLDEARRHVAPLPRDWEKGPNTVGSARLLSASLDLEDTRALLREVPTAWRAQVQEVLLAALGHALASWSGQSRFLVDSEGHGREDLFPGVDLSRTAGWFTSVYPLLLTLPTDASPGDGLRAVRDEVRRLPGKGLGYGLSRHLRRDEELRALPSAEVSFNYLGQLDSALGASSLFSFSHQPSGLPVSPRMHREHLLDVNAYVQGERLQVSLAYSEHLHAASTVQALLDGFLQALRTLIATRASEDARRYTPSDFPLARLPQAELDRLVPPGT